MKKLLSIALCLIMVIAMACMAGCGNDELLKKMDDLQAALQTQRGKIDELQNQNMQFADKFDEMQTVIDGQAELIEFLKYKALQGEFITVTEAYKAGFLTVEHLKSIAYYYQNGREYNEEIMPEDYSPIPKKPESLDSYTDLTIKQKFLEKYLKNYKSITLDDVGVNYYGIYNKCVAVMAWCHGIGYGLTVDDIDVSGVHFYYTVYNRILIWISE